MLRNILKFTWDIAQILLIMAFMLIGLWIVSA